MILSPERDKLLFSHRFFSVFERMRAFVSEKLSLDLKHLELCVIESRIQLNASNRFYELHFFKNAPYILSY